MKTLYVLDTSAVLEDANILDHYATPNSNIIIHNAVLKELDTFKKGNRRINYAARSFLKQLTEIVSTHNTHPELNNKCANGYRYSLYYLDGENSTGLTLVSVNNDAKEHATADEALLDYLDDYQHAYPNLKLITRDYALLLQAQIRGGIAKYHNVIAEPAKYTGVCTLDSKTAPVNVINNMYDDNESMTFESLGITEYYPNSFLKVPAGGSKASDAYFCNTESGLTRLTRRGTPKYYGITPKNNEQMLALNLLTNPDVSLVSLTGVAGTGKTLLALSAALSCKKEYKRIYLAKPLIHLMNQEVGILPGDLNDKILPFMDSLYDNISVIKEYASQKDRDRLKNALESKKIEVLPLSYIRGRSLNDAYIIVDEAQNLSNLEIKTIITRAGHGSKIVLTGDIEQIDVPYLSKERNGLTYVIDRMKAEPCFGHITLTKSERSPLSAVASRLL